MVSGRQPKAFESYPPRIVLATTLASLVTYVIGIYILSLVDMVWGVLFLVYVLYLEFSIYREGCACCYYYGKMCAFGRGKLAPLFHRRIDPEEFCKREVSFRKLVPSMLVLVFPLIGGIALLVMSFSWVVLGLMAIPWLMWFLGNPLIYGKLACAHCKQGRKCCPAMEFFSGKKKKTEKKETLEKRKKKTRKTRKKKR